MSFDHLKMTYPQLLNKTVLIADDNILNQIVLSKILKNAGMETICVENGAEAIRKLLAGLRPAAILMDLEMPLINGVQASKYIKNKIDAEIPIIINSGSVSAYQKAKLINIGINDFLEKPYSMHDIFSKLSKHVSLTHAVNSVQ